jgi:hypothetical protein
MSLVRCLSKFPGAWQWEQTRVSFSAPSPVPERRQKKAGIRCLRCVPGLPRLPLRCPPGGNSGTNAPWPCSCSAPHGSEASARSPTHSVVAAATAPRHRLGNRPSQARPPSPPTLGGSVHGRPEEAEEECGRGSTAGRSGVDSGRLHRLVSGCSAAAAMPIVAAVRRVREDGGCNPSIHATLNLVICRKLRDQNSSEKRFHSCALHKRGSELTVAARGRWRWGCCCFRRCQPARPSRCGRVGAQGSPGSGAPWRRSRRWSGSTRRRAAQGGLAGRQVGRVHARASAQTARATATPPALLRRGYVRVCVCVCVCVSACVSCTYILVRARQVVVSTPQKLV